jgi:prevent-host-death family protein
LEEAISSADARRRFFDLLRKVQEGRSYVVISHGKPVARLIPVEKHARIPAAARTALLSRLKSQPVLNAGRWTRPDIYDDDQ